MTRWTLEASMATLLWLVGTRRTVGTVLSSGARFTVMAFFADLGCMGRCICWVTLDAEATLRTRGAFIFR